MSSARTLIPSLEAFPDFVGVPLGPSEWVTIGQDRIDTFAEVTQDAQWIHCDVERARRESPWKRTIAHGYLTLALAPHLLTEILNVEGWSTVVNTGIEKLRFPAPVPSGSRLRMGAEIAETRRMPSGGVRVIFALRFEVEGESKAALTARVVFVYLP